MFTYLPLLQRTLDSTTFYGCTVVVVVCIAGFVMAKQEGNDALNQIYSLLTVSCVQYILKSNYHWQG